MNRVTNHALPLALLCCVAATATAQEWRTEKIADSGLEIDAPGRLERLPMQLGESGLYHRARFRPKDNQDFVRSQYYWYCDVYEFSTKDPKGDDADLPAGLSPEDKAKVRELMASAGFKRLANFKAWLDEKDKKKMTFEVEGKLRKGRAGRLDFAHWVWKEDSGFGPVGTVYCEAAVYFFEGREVALVIEMPLETKKPGTPKSKWKDIIDRMIPSGKALDAAAAGADADENKKRDQYANTPERKEALADALKNIGGLKGWDLFTQPNYIVIYSWDFEKPDERSKAKKDAEFYASRLEKMRELYITQYPLDATGMKAIMPDAKTIPSLTGPVTGVGQPAKPADGESEEDAPEPAGKVAIKPYPVFRLCATYEQFQKYGQSPPGVVGWYSPMSKELVVFLGGDKMMGQGATETVTYHEGWHQYADFYFHHPDSEKHGTLHRWFDEGHGDYFGSFRWGTQGWKYVGSKMRYEDCKNMVRIGDYVPFKEIVHWDQRRFYSGRAAYYYAQAFSMIDFLRRGGDKGGRNWDPRYAGILDMYRKVMLVKGVGKLATDTAYKDFTDTDWKKLEEDWKAWVGSSNFTNGK